MNTRNSVLVAITMLSPGLCVAAEKYPIDVALGGVNSPYSEAVRQMATHALVPNPLVPADGRPVWLRWLATPDGVKYVAVAQRMKIRAPLARVVALLDDISHYQDLFPGFRYIRLVPNSVDGNELQTEWRQKSESIFVKDTVYSLLYLVNVLSPSKKVYRYKLLGSNQLTASDGFVIVEADGADTTNFQELDLWTCQWGRFGGIFFKFVKSAALEETFLGDAALKILAENPSWNYAKVATEAKSLLIKYPLKNHVEPDGKLTEFLGIANP